MKHSSDPVEIQDSAICDLIVAIKWMNSYNVSGWQCNQNMPLVKVCNGSSSFWSGVTCKINIITSIVLQNQYLQGYISTSIGFLTGLLSLDFTSNRLTGTIPSSIGFLSQLRKLSLAFNNIGGTIPQQLMYLTGLTMLTIGVNELVGPIPSSIGTLSKLITLSFHTNRLTGVAPVSIFDLRNLQNLYLHTNFFEGTLPPDLSKLQFLQTFTIHNNSIYGPIPTTINQLSNCYLLSISYNKLTGTIPTTVATMSKLMYFLVGRNSLTGTLPTSLGALKQLLLFNIQLNQFTGTIPTEFSKLSVVRNLQLFSNRLIGTIPSALGQLPQLQYIRVDSNYLTGSIPTSILNLKALKGFEVGYNQLTGTIPIFSHLPQIQIIRINNNKFFGTISESVFNSTKLIDIDISNNNFSGRLPSLQFKAVGLNVFAASVNCFQSYLPHEVCQAKNLKTLALDGMRIAESCRSQIFKDTSIKTYRLDAAKDQGIPSCIFSMSELKILHLSGNAFKGKLPTDATLSIGFVDLTLSNNLLSGTIPMIFQEKVWSRFDLSYNKFSGVLSDQFEMSYNTTLRLNVNRLSGKVPQQLVDANDIAILEGNIFECNLNTQPLPKHDPKSDNYICGSDTIIFSSIIFIAVFICFGLLELFRMVVGRGPRDRGGISLKRLQSYVYDILYIEDNTENTNSNSNSNHFAVTSTSTAKIGLNVWMRKFMRLLSILVVFILVICLPVYSILGLYYCTHQQRYGWQVSVAFLSGKYTTIALLVVWFFLLLLFAINIPVYSRSLFSIKSDVSWCYWIRSTLVFLGLLVINLIVIIPVIGLYVYSSVAYDSITMTFIQFGIGAFKAIWSELYVKNVAVFKRVILPSTRRDDRNEMISIAIILIINNIIIPVLAEAAIDSNCYYHILKVPPMVSVSYSYGDPCTFTILGYCISPNVGTSTITYTPPFLYSYQCSSILITNFSSVFMYMFVSIAIYAPFRSIFENRANTYQSMLFRVHVPAYIGELLSYVAILITFGAVFPPLALVMYVAITIDICYTQKFILATSTVVLPESCDDESNFSWSLPELTVMDILQLCPFAAIFYSFFLVDILGDEVGLYEGYWAPVVMIGLSMIIFIIYCMVNISQFVNNKSSKTAIPIIITID